MSELRYEADVQSVTVERNADGQIRDLTWSAPIEVRCNYFVVEDDGSEEPEIKKSWDARLRFNVSNGKAMAVQAKDIEGSDGHSNWQGLGYLRLFPVAEDAVANIDGVDEVVRIEDLLGTIIEEGRNAEFNPE